MFNLGIQELAVIFIIALLFIGPKQLPELAKTFGKMFRDFKRASNEITDSLQREARQVTDFKEELHNDIRKDLDVQLLPETESVTIANNVTADNVTTDSTESKEKPPEHKSETDSDDKS